MLTILPLKPGDAVLSWDRLQSFLGDTLGGDDQALYWRQQVSDGTALACLILERGDKTKARGAMVLSVIEDGLGRDLFGVAVRAVDTKGACRVVIPALIEAARKNGFDGVRFASERFGAARLVEREGFEKSAPMYRRAVNG